MTAQLASNQLIDRIREHWKIISMRIHREAKFPMNVCHMSHHKIWGYTLGEDDYPLCMTKKPKSFVLTWEPKLVTCKNCLRMTVGIV